MAWLFDKKIKKERKCTFYIHLINLYNEKLFININNQKVKLKWPKSKEYILWEFHMHKDITERNS